jgi:hypothetical protein
MLKYNEISPIARNEMVETIKIPLTPLKRENTGFT